MTESFEKFHAITRNRPPHRPTVEAFQLLAATQDPRGLSALDLGCGTGRDTRFLLDQGMCVTAVDADTSAMVGFETETGLDIVRSRFDEFVFGRYKFITSQLSLSFNPPASFNAMFQRLLDSLEPGGILTCDIFGPNDDWATNPDYTIMNEGEIRALLQTLEIVQLKEIEDNGATADGTAKHWHTFRLLAQKPL